MFLQSFPPLWPACCAYWACCPSSSDSTLAATAALKVQPENLESLHASGNHTARLRSKACQKLAKGSTNRYHEKRPCVAFFIFLNRPKAQRCCVLIYIHIPKCVYILSPHDLQHQKCSSWTQRCFTQPKKTEEIRFRIHEMHTDPRKKNRKLTKSSKSSVKTGQLHWSLEIPSPPDTLAAVLSCLDQAWHSCSTALGPAATAASLNGGLRDEWDEWDDYSGDRIRLGWKLCYQCAM